MRLHTICERLDAELRTEDFAEIDGSPNGLQVGPTDADIHHVAVAVDAALATIDEAVALEADLLITHHGLWWEGTERVTGRTFERVQRLIEHDIALYVSHLPLDAHPEIGNAAGVGDVLDLTDRQPFGTYRSAYLGQRGRLADPVAISDLIDTLETSLPGAEGAVQVLPFGSDQIESIAIVTGSGIDYIEEAVAVDADVLLTGEGKHGAVHEAKEFGINVILAGHYATETTGVRSIMSLLDDWGLEAAFIDHPTGL